MQGAHTYSVSESPLVQRSIILHHDGTSKQDGPFSGCSGLRNCLPREVMTCRVLRSASDDGMVMEWRLISGQQSAGTQAAKCAAPPADDALQLISWRALGGRCVASADVSTDESSWVASSADRLWLCQHNPD